MGQSASSLTSALWAFLSSPKPDEPGYINRQAAFALAKLAQTASSKSQAAYKQGDHQGAQQLSDLSKTHWKEYHRLNALAEKEIFNHHNPTYPSNLSQIDLHGLLVKEAIGRVEKHVELCKRSEIIRTILIKGWVSHSKDGLV